MKRDESSIRHGGLPNELWEKNRICKQKQILNVAISVCSLLFFLCFLNPSCSVPFLPVFYLRRILRQLTTVMTESVP